MNTDLATTHSWMWIAVIVTAVSTAAAAALYRRDRKLAKQRGTKDAVGPLFGVATLSVGAAVLFGAVAVSFALSPPLADESKNEIVTFMKDTYGFQISTDEAEDIFEGVGREEPENRGVTTTDGTVRLVTFDDRFDELRAYTYGTSNEVPHVTGSPDQ
jgi:hypothetical protein